MRFCRLVVLALSVLSLCAAQQIARSSSAGPVAPPPTRAVAPNPGLSGTGFAAPFGPLRRGMGYSRGPGAGRGGPRGPVVAPVYVGVPIYSGYYYGPDYADAPAWAPPAQPQSPAVIINQNFVPDRAEPVIQDVPDSADQNPVDSYQAPGPPAVEPNAVARPAEDQPAMYLIAFSNHSIVPALAYWVEGNTLKYVNMDHGINQASLELVDRDLSRRLNQERHVEFRLPAAR